MYKSQIKNLKKLWLPNWEKKLGRARISANNSHLSYVIYNLDNTSINIFRTSLYLPIYGRWDYNMSVKLVR